jgi:hypothetical protein
MAGTRTAPAFTAAANERQITLHLVDASGDQYTDNLIVDVAATAAAIETYAAAYAAASNASLWAISDTLLRLGDKDADNAVAEFRATVAEGVNTLYKNTTTGVTITPRLIAPIAATMQGNQDIPLLSSAEFTALIVATLALKTGFALQQAQFTGRRERKNNPRVSA